MSGQSKCTKEWCAIGSCKCNKQKRETVVSILQNEIETDTRHDLKMRVEKRSSCRSDPSAQYRLRLSKPFQTQNLIQRWNRADLQRSDRGRWRSNVCFNLGCRGSCQCSADGRDGLEIRLLLCTNSRVSGIFAEALDRKAVGFTVRPVAPRSNTGTSQLCCSVGSGALKCRDLAAARGAIGESLMDLVGIGIAELMSWRLV